MSGELTRESAPDFGPVRQRVVLVKVDGLMGGVPVGTQYESLSSRGLSRFDAERRAWRKLKRDHPDENTMCWQVERYE